jgi:alpha-L-rhamnosidase
MATSNEHQEDASMISFNHYAYGAVVDWMYRNVGGIKPLSPGYRQASISPRPVSGLTYCRSQIHTRFGSLESAWNIASHGDLVIRITVPFGVTSVLDLPVTDTSRVTVNGAVSTQGASIGHGTHTVVVTQPSIVDVERY